MIASAASSEVVRVGKFGLVGILNTLIDFLIFNILSSKAVGLSKIWANTASTTVAMTFSFFANRQFVFDNTGRNPVTQAAVFFVVTAFGLYVIQNLIIYFLATKWAWPTSLVKRILKITGLKRILKTDFVVKNGAKIVATVASLTWNYIMYKLVVFN